MSSINLVDKLHPMPFEHKYNNTDFKDIDISKIDISKINLENIDRRKIFEMFKDTRNQDSFCKKEKTKVTIYLSKTEQDLFKLEELYQQYIKDLNTVSEKFKKVIEVKNDSDADLNIAISLKKKLLLLKNPS
ncbi:hypothetical protein [Buchnera aphidicola]|uniref:hypothetical protein n=1 Tax=Buchnera aphidicola TaxID=9 RepID=UPI003464B3C9